MKAPFAVIYRDGRGRDVIERHYTPQSVNERLNELWGPFGRRGPSRHAEARGVLGDRVIDPSMRKGARDGNRD